MLKLPILPSLLSLAATTGISTAATVKPAIPSNLKVKTLGVNSFQVKWKDNSDNEAGWEIWLAANGAKPVFNKDIPVPNLTSDVIVMASEFTSLPIDFQVRAYSKDANGKKKFSAFTPVSRATSAAASTFNAPTGLKAKTVDDGTVKLTWKDNSTTEQTFLVECKKKSAKKWTAMAAVPPAPNGKFISTGLLEPATEYNFRVRAVKSNAATGVHVTAYTNIAAATTKPFQVPGQLRVTAESDGAFSFKWKDNSSLGNFELQRKIGDGEFTPMTFSGGSSLIPGSLSSFRMSGFDFNANHQFRLRGVRTVGTKTVYTAFSNIAAVKATSLAKPTELVTSAVSDSSVKLTWKDASDRENGYRVDYREAGATGDFSTAAAGAGVKGQKVSYTVTGLRPGTLYDFRVYAVSKNFFGQELAASIPASGQGRPKDGLWGDFDPPVFYGTSFSYDINVTRASELTSLTVTGRPAWLAYDSSNRRLTGIPTEEGVKTLAVTAKFKDGRTVAKSLVLRIIRPEASPEVTESFTPVSVEAGADLVVPVTGKFADPDTPSAVRFTTSKGNFDIILYSQATPETVDNFLDYVDAGRYDHSFFHRAVDNVDSGLVITQGGGYTYTSADGFKKVPRFMQTADPTKERTVTNEPGISNLRGTVAMAKLGGQPDSATSEFFVNADDENAGNLDEQNSGFTVFGRIPDSGMEIVDDIIDLPKGSYSFPGLSSLSDVPMDAATAPVALEPDKLVMVHSAQPAPILVFEATSLDEGVATVTVSGSELTIHGAMSGTTTVRVKAIDLDGNSVTQDIAVTVP